MTVKPDLFPDCLAKSRRGAIPGPGGYWLPVYCANCGSQSGGYVPEPESDGHGGALHAFWLCTPCLATHGELTTKMQSPNQVLWEKMKQEQMATYGRYLTGEELLALVAEGTSPLAKLIIQGHTP